MAVRATVPAGLAALVASVVLLASATLLGGCGKSEPDFALKDGVWHYRNAAIPEADARSFKVLDDHHAKDSRQVYYADSYRKGQEYWSIRHDRVRTLEGADPASFRVLRDDYARDARQLYYEGRRVEVKDLETFEILADGFARDRVTGYYLRVPVQGSDGASFEVLDYRYSRDKSRVYYSDYDSAGGTQRPSVRTMVLKGADPASITVLDRGYAKTAKAVWFRGEPVRGAHAESFETPPDLLEGADARDRNGHFQHGARVPAPAA